MPPDDDEPHTALVLSGGGARGAYEAGVVCGIIDVLREEGLDKAPFDIFSGTSVGALNTAYLAAHADEPDMGTPQMLQHWRELDLDQHLKIDLRGLLGWRRDWSPHAPGPARGHRQRLGRSILDPRGLDYLARQHVPWERIHRNVQNGTVRALVVAALHIASGKTTMFAELADGVPFRASRDPRRRPAMEPITAEHVLASSAIPLLFPAHCVGDDFYCDGGIRFNTPIAPAIRAGADRLVVVSLLPEETATPEPSESERERELSFQNPIFLMGKVLNALLLDPIDYDLHVLERFNHLLATLENVLEPHEMDEVRRAIAKHRGTPYRTLDTLVFHPTRDIGHMARQRAEEIEASRFSSWFLARAAALGTIWESDLLSFILFDGEFADQLIELGHRDAQSRAAEIRAFFRNDT